MEATLRAMAARAEPLVRELPRRPGQQDHRWVHLLGPLPAEVAPAVAVDRDAVLAQGPEQRDARVRSSYDAVATAYADHLLDELDALPFERWLLDRVAADAASGPVVEVGSGPGHVTAHLAGGCSRDGHRPVRGMVAEARRRFPEVDLEVGDLRRLGRPPTSSGGRRSWPGTP